MSRNRLDRETSPYLLQHRDNPVHWHAWGPDAFQEARKYGKPVLLSIGYAACHWCHVMAHESFEDPQIAELMNELFVNIKVDREERPDIDAIYMHSLALLGQQGGWPLTMFLTSDGEPFWGGTYFPPKPAHGRPSFREVLREVHQVYMSEPGKIANNRDALKQALNQMSQTRTEGALSLEIIDQAVRALARQIDQSRGGLRGAPKFPQSSIFEMLWRGYLRSKDDGQVKLLNATLENICQGGIFDHLGGGISRYSVDENWLVPHFEKMLYDNAQFIDLLSMVWPGTHSTLYAWRLFETVGWVQREMVLPEGGFAASLDADSEGVEGKFYVWDETGIDRLLGLDAKFFKQHYDVTPVGNWEGHTILNRLKDFGLGSDADERRLALLRDKLLRVREQRIPPARDDKALADWNGMMIAALANAAAVFDRPSWFETAARAFEFVIENMTGKDGRLAHSWCAGKASGAEILDDYAQMSRAALNLYELTGFPGYLDWAVKWVAEVNERFWDSDNGGYFYTPKDASDLIVRTRQGADNATPSGNGVMAGVLVRLGYLTGDMNYRMRAIAVTEAFGGEARKNYLSVASLLNSFESLEGGVQIIILGDRADKHTQKLLQAIYSQPVPDRTVMVIAPGTDLPKNHPARNKTQRDNRATAYVCRGPSCSMPLTDPGMLADAIDPRKALK
ncbi:MAG: thioredoxin domain-containing protein [Alphaproteobacteria bacterium]|nr:thioredoxin domain-containing protein [Alphaproteobacteria bacterium]